MKIDRAGRHGRTGGDVAHAEALPAARRPAGTPNADYPSVVPHLPGREATEHEFHELFGDLEPDDEP
jgi:hypothetical protein